MSKCQKKGDRKKVRDLKVKNLCVQNVNAKNIVAENTTTENLNVNSIILNGRDITCELSGPVIEDHNTGLDPVDEQGRPLRNPNINEAVFNALLCNAQLELVAAQERIAEGRAIIQQFEEDNACPQCGPTGGVPMSIYGYITKPLLTLKQCGFTGGTGPSELSQEREIIQRMSYNLEVDYDVTVANSTQARVCTVLCQLAYMDPEDNTGITGATGPCAGPTGSCGNFPTCGPVFVEEIVIGNKQFYPTLDVLYGEMFSGDVHIDTFLAQIASTAMPDPTNSAAVQLVFFVEEGLTIWTEESSRKDATSKDSPGNVGTAPAPGGPCGPGLVACIEGGVDISRVAGCIPKVVPAFTFAIVPALPYLTVQFTNTSTGAPGNGIRYEWNFGDNTPISTAVSPSHTYAAPNTYQVTLSAEYFTGGSFTQCYGKEFTSQSVEVTGTPP